jgi:hypothetical protein
LIQLLGPALEHVSASGRHQDVGLRPHQAVPEKRRMICSVISQLM